VLVSLHPKLKQTKHQILIDGDRQLMIETVPGALSQVITNLVMNSLTHGYEEKSDSGIIKINIIAENTEIVITYSDDGKGMDDETVKRIYEPFFTTRRGSGGSGLGLSIIFNLVTQTLGGVIHCSTKINEGVQFEIRFPINKVMENNE
jgi:signal transduction histidine kinase